MNRFRFLEKHANYGQNYQLFEEKFFTIENASP